MRALLVASLLAILVSGCGCSCGTEIEPVTPPTLPPGASDTTTPSEPPPQELEVEPLVISDVRVTDVKSDSAVVRWETNRPATSVVKYRIGRWSAERVYSVENIRHIESHRVKLRDLLPGRTYAIYSITCTGSDSAEYRDLVVFNTPYPDGFWTNIGGGFGGFMGSIGNQGEVTVTYAGGDGSWNDNTHSWTVNAYPAESKNCNFSIHNGKGYAITVYMDATLISCPAGGEAESNFGADSIVIPSGGSKNMEVVVSFTQSAPIGVYVGSFSFNY